ncbi:MAG: hypothetical protein HPY89_07135 [Pelotomaculum sp.]|nr:hypothetical protein [Pelotomaculum sp.]
MRVKSRQTAVPFLVLCFVLAFAGAAFAAAFSDTGGHWAESRIVEWAQKGLVQGYPDGTFRPDGEVTRAEFVALINRAFGIAKAGAAGAVFADVKPGDWFYEDVMAAKAAGYIAGYPDGTFMPDRNITRQEAAVILARLLGLQPDAGGAAGFADGGTIGAWAAGSVGAVARAGLMVGMPDGTFMPLKGTTRAEAVVLLDRAAAYKPAGTIEGSVTLDGRAAAGASVRVFAAGGFVVLKEAVTGGDGKFKVELAPGEYDVTAAAAAEVAYAGGVKVASSQAARVSLALEPAAVLSGVLKDKDGSSAVKNTAVLFTTNPTFAARTDGEGKFTVPVLPNRTYTVRTYDPGKKDAAPEVVKTGLEVGPAGKYDIGTLNAPFEVSAVSGGGGGGGGPGGPVVLTEISAGTYSDARGYKIASFGTFGPASGTATFTSKLIIDPGDTGTLTLRNISAGEIEVLSGGKSSVHTQNVNAGRLVASASGGVKIEAGEGTVITTTEVQGETHIAVAPGASASFGAITIKSGAAGKTVAFSGDLSGSTVTVEAAVTLQFNEDAKLEKLVIDAPVEVSLSGSGSIGTIQVPEEIGQQGTPVINFSSEINIGKLELYAPVEFGGNEDKVDEINNKLPRIESFAGAAPGDGNIIEASLNNISTTTAVKVSRDCSLALNVEGLGCVSRFNLTAGANDIYNILVPGAGDIDLSDLNLSALYSAAVDCPDGTKNDILNAVDYDDLYSILAGPGGVKGDIIGVLEGVLDEINDQATEGEINDIINALEGVKDPGTMRDALETIVFTDLLDAVARAGADTALAVAGAVIDIAGILRQNGISRDKILDTINFGAINKESLFDWLSRIDGNASALTIQARLTDAAGNTGTYTVNIVKQ